DAQDLDAVWPRQQRPRPLVEGGMGGHDVLEGSETAGKPVALAPQRVRLPLVLRGSAPRLGAPRCRLLTLLGQMCHEVVRRLLPRARVAPERFDPAPVAVQ